MVPPEAVIASEVPCRVYVPLLRVPFGVTLGPPAEYPLPAAISARSALTAWVDAFGAVFDR